MSEIDPELLKQLQEAFVIEAREQLQSIMNSVISLESSNDDAQKSALAEDILRDLHSMKGNSRAAGVIAAEALCQSFESAILSMRRKKELLHAEAADVLHKAIDLLDDLINKVEADQAEYVPESFADIMHKLKILDERQRLAMEAQEAAANLAAQNTTAQAQSGLPPATAVQSAQTTAPQSAASPAITGPATVPQPVPAIDTVQAEAAASKAKSQPAGEKGASTRVALWKLDKLLRESEEMLILKQISEQHLDDLRDLKILAKRFSAENSAFNALLKTKKQSEDGVITERELSALAQNLNSLSNEFEQSLIARMRRQQTEQRLCFNMVDGFIDSVKSLLMQDFTGLLSVVPKVVRDLSRELKKEVDLEIFGTEIEIDRRILEEIKDPVIHLVRNSLDHGIETSEDRVAKGKAARASLRIGASQDESGNVKLIISDDGKGINAERLKAAALKEGAISAEEAQKLSDQEAIELMYRSAVSTSDTVTEISGRGLGMAIVRERIQELGGRVIVETELGKGTTFTLKLPTKLSTFRGIQILCAAHSFIIPTLHVHYAGRIARSEIKQSGSRNLVNINGQLISVQNLSDILRLESKKEFKTKAMRSYHQLLVLESGNTRAGFLVDEILHEHEVLVRGLSYPLVRVANISGATILGSGQVVPVLNIADLMDSSSKASFADEKLKEELLWEQERSRKLAEMPVFLVDRHSTSQVMLKSFLESEGYVVQTYNSNETALEGLENLDLPLILLKSCELSETHESGLAFWIRKDLRLKDLPIVFFGSYPSEEGWSYSQSQGGDAYFSKIDFNRKQILEMIERLT